MEKKKSIKGLTAESISVKLERREKSCRKVSKMPENKLNDEKVLAMFVDRLIADKGGDTLDAKQKETLQKELLEELDERIQQAMIRALPDAKLMELEKLLDEDAPDEEIEGFFKGADADFDPAIRKAMDEFRTDYFKDKIKVSVKTSILETAPATVTEVPKAEVSQAAPAVPVTPAPVAAAAPVGSATPATAPVVPAEQPLQAAPNLMDALNTATANLNTATANLNPVTGDSNVATANLNTDAGASVATNTDTTGKEA